MPELARDDIQGPPANPRDTHGVLDKRRAILLAARELFATQGYDETTIAQIARVGRVAVGTVYLYFENKRDILVEVCVALNAEIANVFQSPAMLALPLRQIPRAAIEASFRRGRENQRFMSCYSVAAESPEEMARLRAADQGIADALDVFFQHLVAQGQAPPFDTTAYALLLTNLVSSTLKQCFGLENGEREEFYREGAIALVERLFFGPPIVSVSPGAGTSVSIRDAASALE